MSDKLMEANECYNKAEKYLKTGFLKWKPDYDNAANEYSRAATCFKAIGIQDKCLDAHLKAADCFVKNKSYFSAAKSYEQSAVVSKEINDWDSVIKYYEHSCHLFREHGVPDTAALTLNRGAQIIESKYPEKAAEWYGQSSEVTMLEDRPRQAAEYANKGVRIYLKLKKFDEAVAWMRKAMNYLLEAEDNHAYGRLVVSLVLVQLARDDIVAAQKAFQEGRSYVEQEEIYTLTQILDGFDQMDSNAIYSGLNSPFIKNLDNELTKLARSLQQKHAANIMAPTQGTNQSQDEEVSVNEEAGAML